MDTGEQRKSVNEFFRASRPVSESLPLSLRNGARVDTLTCRCSRCHESIPDQDFRGDANPSLAGYRLTAFGYCKPCNLLTPYMYDVAIDGAGFALRSHGWKGWRRGEVVPLQSKK